MQSYDERAYHKVALAADLDEGTYPNQNSSVRLLKILRAAPKIEEYGFCLTRSKWDPYPWVSKVSSGTPAAICGLKTGDCILKVNGVDIVGMKISDVAQIVKSHKDHVSFLCWNSEGNVIDEDGITSAPVPTILNRLVLMVDNVIRSIECPVCNITISPPVMQCQNGHILCLDCRIRTENCPICRGYFTPIRSTIAEEIYSIINCTFEKYIPKTTIRQTIIDNMTYSKTNNYNHCVSTSSTSTTSPRDSKHRTHCLSTYKLLTKLLQASANPIDNRTQPILTKTAKLPEELKNNPELSAANSN